VKEDTADVKVGTLVALTVDEGVDWKSVVVPSVSATPAPSSKPVAAGLRHLRNLQL